MCSGPLHADVRRIVAVLVASLVLAACGTRLTDDERGLFAGTGDGGSAAATPSASSGGAAAPGGATSSSGSGAVAGTTPGAGGPAASGDPAGGGAGPVAGDGGAGAAAEACAAPSAEVGVTDSTLTLGGVFQLSGLLPGFAQTAAYGAQAYAEYLNDNGGLCGRQVEYLVLDDGFDASRNAEQTSVVIERALSSVGGFSAADDGGAGALGASNILDVSVGTTPAKQSLPNHYPLLGPELRPGDAGLPLPEYRYAVEQGATRLAVVTVAAAAGRALLEDSRRDAQAAGMEVVLELEVSPTQFSYTSTARAIADSGAQMILCLLEINGSVQLAEELARIPNSVDFAFYRLGYDQRFLDLAGAAAEGVVSFIEFLPFEEVGSNAALDAFLAYYDRVAPGEAPTYQAIQGWIAMEMYTQVIRSLAGPISRDALLAAAANLRLLRGNGLFQDLDFASRERPACKVVMRVVDGRYQREAPATGFYC